MPGCDEGRYWESETWKNRAHSQGAMFLTKKIL